MEAEVTGILAFSEKSVIYTAGWNKCINVYRDDKDVGSILKSFFFSFLRFRFNSDTDLPIEITIRLLVPKLQDLFSLSFVSLFSGFLFAAPAGVARGECSQR